MLQTRVDQLQVEADRAMELDERLAQAQAQLVEAEGTTQLLQEVEKARDGLQNQVALLEQRLMELDERLAQAQAQLVEAGVPRSCYKRWKKHVTGCRIKWPYLSSGSWS